MQFFRQLFLLLWKNFLLKIRSPISLCCELGLPLGLIGIFAALYFAFEVTKFKTQQYISDEQSVEPFFVLPRRMQLYDWRIGLVASGGQSTVDLRDNFVTWMSTVHPAFNGTEAGFLTEPFKNLNVPAFADVIRTFDSGREFDNYVKNNEYASRGDRPRVWAAVDFESFDATSGAVRYKLRFNITDMQDTFETLDPVQREPFIESQNNFIQVIPEENDYEDVPEAHLETPADREAIKRPMPSASTLQREVDRFLIQRRLDPTILPNINVETVNEIAGSAFFQLGFNFTEIGIELAALERNNLTDTVLGGLAFNSFASEQYQPQSVSVMPFPISEFDQNDFYGVVSDLLPFFFILTLVYPISQLIRGLVLEKETRIREGMQMMGLGEGPLIVSWILTYVLIFMLLAILIAAITSNNMFKESSFGPIFFLFWILGIASTAFGYFVSVFFNGARTASFVGVLLFIGIYFPYTSVSGPQHGLPAKRAASLCAPTAFSLSLNQAVLFEQQGLGVAYDNSDLELQNWQYGIGLWMMVIDTLLYLFLGWYFDNVLPSWFRQYGVPRPFYFLCTGDYWGEVFGAEAEIHEDGAHSDDSSPSMRVTPSGKVRDGRSSVASVSSQPTNPNDDPAKYPNIADYHLVQPLQMEQRESLAQNKGIKIRGLRKQFGDKVAVHGLNFELMENQVNCLLGHNGAGKTTTIGMLTGLISPSAGTAKIYGYDIRTQMSEIRKMLGVCPQHDVLWPELTVSEHLNLYAGFKGVPQDKVNEEVQKAIRDVGLTEKEHQQTQTLSGGQKRKLSVAIAFIGNSRLVLLDEPTSGVDAYSRRSMWDIIKQRRSGCTILLTTHFMDEADKLGDRVTIAAHGKIQCSGTPLFLKSKYGVGYQLSIVKKTSRDGERDCDVRAVTRLVRGHVEGADIASNVGTELIYRLPLGQAANFAAMFAALDEDMQKDPAKQQLNITSYGVSVTTMEEVFLRVAHGEAREEVLGSAQKGASSRKVGQKATGGGAAGASADSREVEMTDMDGKAAPAKEPAGDPEEGGLRAQPLTIDAVRERARRDADNLCLRHFMALLTKRACYIRRDFLAFCFQLLIPTIVVIFALLLLRSGTPTEFPEVVLDTAGVQSRNLDTYVPILSYYSTNPAANGSNPVIVDRIAEITDSNLVLNMIGSDSAELPTTGPLIDQLEEDLENAANSESGAFTPFRRQLQGGQALPQPDYDYARLSQYLINNREARESAQMGAFAFKSKLFNNIQDGGATAASYTVLHNTTYYFGAGLWPNIMNSALYREARQSRSEAVDESTHITMAIHPLPFTAQQELFVGSFISLFAALAILVAFSFIPASYAVFIVREREVSAKHQQLISGVSIWAYWFSTFVFDFATYLIPCFLTIAVIAAYNIEVFIDTADQRLAGLFLIFLAYGLSVAAFTYCLTYLFKSYTAALVSVLALNIFAVLLMIASFVMDKIKATCREDRVLRYIYRLIPGYALGNGLLNLSFLDQLALLDRICDAQHNPDSDFGQLEDYKALDWNALGANIWMMLIEAVVYFCIAVGIDYIQANPALLRICSMESTVVPEPAKHVDQDVRAEAQRVKPMEGKGSDDILIVKDIRKCYPGGKQAVKGVSFGVPVGNVFALLGINGAGKSSTFKMLSGDTVPTDGSAMVAGYDVVEQQMDVRRLLGYCPQFDALLDLLTVREHLELYGRIKSVPEEQLEDLVQQKMEQMDIVEYENVQSYQLSGGNKRKLSVAIALIGDPPLILLDECTTGVDPVARRKLWTVIQDITDKQRICSIVICTHSMEEAESLSNNLTIMVSGRLKCLGSTQHIKNRFGKAYMAEIRMADVPDDKVVELAQSMLNVGADVLDSHRVSRAEIKRLCQTTNRTDRVAAIAPGQAGWAINAALMNAEHSAPPAMRASAGISARKFLQWWAEMDQSEAMQAYICNEAFPARNAVPGSEGVTRVVERHGQMFRFKIPFQRNTTLGQMFSTLEDCKERLNMEEYSLSQTSLEQIFNQFAAEQEEETTLAPGMISANQSSQQQQAQGGAASVAVSPNPAQRGVTDQGSGKLV